MGYFLKNVQNIIFKVNWGNYELFDVSLEKIYHSREKGGVYKI